MSEQLRVVVASNDVSFVRLAAVAMSRSGQAVRTMRLGATQLERVLVTGMADVVVLDDEAMGTRIRGLIAERALPVAVVQVGEDGEGGLTKWGPLGALIDEVQRSADTVKSGMTAPHLRIVS